MSVLSAWQAWHHGDNETPPLKRVYHVDIGDNQVVRGKSRPIRPTEVRYLGSLNCLCKALDSAAGISSRNVPSHSEIVRRYNSPEEQAILPGNAVEDSRVHRPDELNWRYAVDGMRKRARNEIES